MSTSQAYRAGFFFGKQLYLFIAAVAAIPVWPVVNTLVKEISVPEDEWISSAITISIFLAIFVGRYIAQIWTLRTDARQRRVIAALASIIAICLGWIFFYLDFPLRERVAISLLLTWMPLLVMSLSLGMLIKTIKALTEKQLEEARSSAAHSESELRLLQSQLSPHFLFNTLNNMYGLSITQHEKIPPLLLRLSDLLRYSVYGSGEMFVPLKYETDYINNYIEFEKIRLGDRLVLNTDMELSFADDVKIAPMLLIVFVENAFKHARNTSDEKIFIEIGLKTWNNLVLFSVKNSHSKQERSDVFDKNSGFGLDNVKRRLELLYEGNYKLDIEEEDSLYSVMLQVKIKNK